MLVVAKKVLLNIILIKKDRICIYFQHTFTYANTKLVSSIDLTRSIDETSFVVAYVNVC